MIRKLILTIALIFACLSAKSDNKAVLIGIGNYPEDSGWGILSSERDVALLKKALPSSFTTISLINHQATKNRIVDTLAKLSSQTAAGDTVIIHFSAHGQQMLTDDPNEPDRLDEAIAAYDSHVRESANYHGKSHLIDDELGKLIHDIALRAGKDGLVFVTIDACHSDDIQRGENDSTTVYRGVEDVFGAEKLSTQELEELKKLHYEVNDQNMSREDNIAKIVYFSACLARQRNQEIEKDGTHYGSLSYALAQNLNSKNLHNLSEFIDGLVNQMKELRLSQDPNVRTNFDYEMPETVLPDGPTATYTSTSEGFSIWAISGISIIVILIVLILVWKRKRRKTYCRQGY